MVRQTRTATVEPISPELVLVDPELARVARVQLPDFSAPVASPRLDHARPPPLAELEANERACGAVNPGEADRVEIGTRPASEGAESCSSNSGKGELLRQAFEARLAER